jgi:hypothetical protein
LALTKPRNAYILGRRKYVIGEFKLIFLPWG